MSTEIAPWGEREELQLQNVLIRLAKAAREAEGFISRKMDGWSPGQQAAIAPDLWNGSEPCFLGLMEAFHRSMRDLRHLSRENESARSLLYSIQPMEWNQDTEYVRGVLKTVTRVANTYLATHQVKEVRPVGKIYVKVFTILCWVHQGVWVVQKRIRGRKDC